MSKRRKVQPGQGAAVANKWGAGVAQAGAAYLQGANAYVQRTGQSPTQAAANNLQGYLAGVQGAAKRWQACCAAFSGQDWLNYVKGKGVQNYQASGNSQIAKSHYATFLNAFIPAVQGAMAGFGPKGPRGTNLARWTQYYQWVTGQRGNFKHLWCGGGGGGNAGQLFSPAGAPLGVGGGALG